MLEKAAKVNSEQAEGKKLQNSVFEKLKEVQTKEAQIQEKLASIQQKLKDITCPYPDDYVLNMFLNDLAHRIEERSVRMLSCKTRFARSPSLMNRSELKW